MHRKNQKTNLVHLYIHLVETFYLILKLKIVLKKFLWLKLSILKKIHYMQLNPLIPGGNKRPRMLKNKPTPFTCMFA